MGALRVVVMEPFIEIGLQLLNGFVQVFAKRYLIELLQYGFTEPFANAVGLGRFHFGFGVVNIPSQRLRGNRLWGSD